MNTGADRPGVFWHHGYADDLLNDQLWKASRDVMRNYLLRPLFDFSMGGYIGFRITRKMPIARVNLRGFRFMQRDLRGEFMGVLHHPLPVG